VLVTYSEFQPNKTTYFERADISSFSPFSKMQLSVSRLSLNLHSLRHSLCRILSKSDENSKQWQIFLFRPSVKYVFVHLFHETNKR